MIKATAKISSTFILEVEHYLFEFAPHNWVLHTDPKEITNELTGFFESTSAAKKSFEEIFDNNTSLQSDVLSFDTIHDEDWKNSYKKMKRNSRTSNGKIPFHKNFLQELK